MLLLLMMIKMKHSMWKQIKPEIRNCEQYHSLFHVTTVIMKHKPEVMLVFTIYYFMKYFFITPVCRMGVIKELNCVCETIFEFCFSSLLFLTCLSLSFHQVFLSSLKKGSVGREISENNFRQDQFLSTLLVFYVNNNVNTNRHQKNQLYNSKQRWHCPQQACHVNFYGWVGKSRANYGLIQARQTNVRKKVLIQVPF